MVAHQRHILVLIGLAIAALVATPTSTAEACGVFRMVEVESKRNLQFAHSMVRINGNHSRHEAISIRGWEENVDLYGASINFELFGSPRKKQIIGEECSDCWSLKQLRKKLKFRKYPTGNAIWFEGTRILFEGRVIGSWTPTTMILGDHKFEIQLGMQTGRITFGPTTVTHNGVVTLKSDRVLDVCNAASGQEPKRKSGHPSKLAYQNAVWKRIALYLIARTIAEDNAKSSSSAPKRN